MTDRFDVSFLGLLIGINHRRVQGVLGCLMGGRKSFLFSGYYPSMAGVTGVVKISKRELDGIKQRRHEVDRQVRSHTK